MTKDEIKSCDTCKWCCGHEHYQACRNSGLIDWQPKPRFPASKMARRLAKRLSEEEILKIAEKNHCIPEVYNVDTLRNMNIYHFANAIMDTMQEKNK